MRTTRQMSVTLPLEMADMVRARVESGDYASESEVIREGLRSLAARDRAIESWLRDQVVPGDQGPRDRRESARRGRPGLVAPHQGR